MFKMRHHAKSRASSSSSKSAHSTYSMHKGSGPAQRKRKPHNQSSNDQPKKRRIIRNVSEVQSGPGLRDGIVPRLTERQQLALAMEESKKAAAALQAKDRQASRQMISEDEYSDRREGASESEQDSVSEDESAVKPHRRAIKSAEPARSLTSQHSDVASQLGQHDHKLCAKSGRLESLSGGSKQSQSTSSKLRLSADSSNLLSSGRPHLHHVNSDADSHPRRATSQARLPIDSGKRSASVERQRTSDLSSRDVLDAAEDGKLKDEMQSEGVAAVSLPLEDGMDLLDKRTQRLALRKALSHTMSLHPETSARLDPSNAPGRLHKLLHAKSDLQATANGFSASPKHPLKALKVRVKSEDKPHQQLNGMESPAAADLVQHKRSRGGTQTPRDHHLSDATPRARNGQHPRTFDATPRSSYLATHLSAPMAQLVESDLFGDFSPRNGNMEPRTSAPVQDKLQDSAVPAPMSAQKVVKRKLGKPGRPRTVNRLPGGSQDVLRSPAADARCQAMAEANHMEFTVPTAGPMAPPETDAQLLEPSSSAAKSRGRARKNAKQTLPTLSTLGSRSSMMLASNNTAADRPFSRRQASSDLCSPSAQTSTEVVKEQPLSFVSACASLWAPLQTNRASDWLYESKKWRKDDLTYQDVRSPRRATSHRMYDSGWDDLQARQSCEIGTLQTYQEWCPK
ncbi:hypothetical protein WJX79_000471 [Trebouxia sp. C0005]